MRRTWMSFAAALALGIGSAGIAQEQAPQVPPASAPATNVSEEQLEQFAELYVDLRETAQKYDEELTSAETPEETQEVQTKLHEESMEKLSEHGWTLDMYNMVVEAINANPTLAERVVAMIEERS